jgi:hypothetical protein
VRGAQPAAAVLVALACGACSLPGPSSTQTAAPNPTAPVGPSSTQSAAPNPTAPAGGSTSATVPPGSTAAAVAQAQRTHEYPSPPVRQHALGGFATPALAVAAFANGYINWTAATVTGRMRGLAALSVGQARSAMNLAAAQTAQDYELRRSGVANSGTVEAIAPVRAQAGHYAVVTRELTTASHNDAYRGLRPSWHVALATVTPAPGGGGWVVSAWQPEN